MTMQRRAILFALVLAGVGCDKSSDNGPTTVPVSAAPTGEQPVSPPPGPKITAALPAWNVRQEAVDPPPAREFTGNRLGEVPVGTTVWIEPYTVWVAWVGNDQPNRYFVNGYHNYSEVKKDGLLEITRESDGWVVNLHETGFEWTAMRFPGFTGGGYDSQPVRFRH
jgi:hypothetical protein